jgi:PAB-dependent poly(A)-specific ribonuclease subunit 3
LTNENAVITAKQSWKKIVNSNIVSIVDIFTNRSFGDAGLMVVTDYFPLSKTLAEAHLSNSLANRVAFRSQGGMPSEPVLWSYFVQIANALKAIHVAGLAARVLDPSKIILTSKNRIRLNGCAILDVVQFDAGRSIAELQLEDLTQLGKLLLILGTNNRTAPQNPGPALEQFGRSYSSIFKDRVAHLIGAGPQGSPPPRIDTILAGLEGHILGVLDGALHENDNLNTELYKELENARLVRLMVKINFITERPEYGLDRQWSETGERYPIKLFRDYVFHQVDANGNPNLDLGWVLTCLNKLDAGSEERMRLVTRDEQTMLMVSYKEMKRLIEGAFQELVRASRR